jgi:outer membrane protein TolC
MSSHVFRALPLRRREFLLSAALLLCPGAAFATEPLSLTDAIRAAEQTSPRLAAQRAAIDASQAVVSRASELPDPKLTFGIENLPVTGPDAYSWNADFMTMRRIGVIQDFPSATKRRLRTQRAAAESEVEQANLAAGRALVQRDVARAWFEVLYAQRIRAAVEDLAQAFALQVETSRAAVAGGRGTPTEALASRVALEDVRNRLIEQDRTVARARVGLSALIGDAAERPLGAGSDTGKLAHDPNGLLAGLAHHPELKVYEQREALAQTDVALANAGKSPDWSLDFSYGYRRPNFSNMVTLMVAIDLPIAADRRQNRDVAAKQALIEQVRSEREEARRMHEAEVRGEIVDWETAERRVERFDAVLLPLARERSAAALAAYGGGRGSLDAVLAAKRAETETRIAQLQAELERARAWANLTYLAPQEHDQ